MDSRKMEDAMELEYLSGVMALVNLDSKKMVVFMAMK